MPIYPADITTLIFSINVIGITRIRKDKEAISIVQVFPAAIGDAAGILRVPDPATVVLQPAIDMIRILVVHADMVELRDGKVVALPPFAPAVVRIPHPSIIPRKDSLRIGRIDPDAMNVPVHSTKPANRGEAFPRILTNDHRAVGLKKAVGIFRIND